MNPIRRRLCAWLAIGCAGTGAAHAQGNSGRPLGIVIPFAPGGASDVVVRLLGDVFARDLGRPVAIENKGGAGGLIAATAVARAAPDGNTLLYGNQGQVVVARHLFGDDGFDPRTALAPVSLVARTQFVLVVSPSSAAATAPELLHAGRRDRLRIGVPGIGTPPHLATLLLGEATGLAFDIIPYQGSAPVLVDLMAGRIDAAFDNVASSLPHLRAGTLRALAVAGSERSAVLRDVPTLAESGLAGFSYQAWQAFFVPKGTASETIAALAAVTQRALAEPATRTRLQALGLDVVGSSPSELAAVMARDAERWDALGRTGVLRKEGR